MSGSGGGGGYKYQAEAFAYLATYALAKQPLDWFDTSDQDIPIAISSETGGAGDDLQIELASGEIIEVQCKKGAKKDSRFTTAFVRAVEGLTRNPKLRVVLLVNNNSHNTIKNDFSQDIIRLGQGRTDNLKPITSDFFKLLAKENIVVNNAVFSRLRLIVKNFDPGVDGREAAINLLTKIVKFPTNAKDIWKILFHEGMDLIEKRGRRDLTSLIKLVGGSVEFSPEFHKPEKILEKYRNWILSSNREFFVPGLNIRIPIQNAWEELLFDKQQPSAEVETMARQISHYHEWEKLSENIRRESNVCKATGLVLGRKNLVIIGGPGSGKSTLSRRLAVWATEKGAIILRVSLRQVVQLWRSGISFERALLQIALEGSNVSAEAGQLLFSSPNYLIADGLDECDPNRVDIANQLVAWSNSHPDCRICVLTRPVGHSQSLLPEFTHAELLPLSDLAIEEISTKLIQKKIGDEKRADELSTQFREHVTNRSHKRKIASIAARNPLLLSFLVCLFLNGESLTGRRVELLGQIIDLIARSPLKDRISKVEVDRAIADRVIEFTAWQLINTPDISSRALLDLLADDLAKQIGEPLLKVRRLAEQGLHFWEERGLIEYLTLGHLDAYTFVHLSLGEYLAGRFINQMDESTLYLWLKSSRDDLRWRQPILMACGLGAANKIISLLLDLDEPGNPVSVEANVAAAAVTETKQVDPNILARIVKHFRQRLISDVPLIAIEAGEGLRQIAPHIPEVVNEVTDNLINDKREWTQLAVFTARIAADKSYVTVEQTLQWLKKLHFAIHFYTPRSPAERRIHDLPRQAYDLQEFSLITAIEKFFAEFELEQAKQVVASSLERFSGRLSSGTTMKLAPILMEQGAGDLAIKLMGVDKYDWSNFYKRIRGDFSSDKVFLENIVLVTESSKLRKSNLKEDSQPSLEFVNLSILLSGLEIWEADLNDARAINESYKESELQEVLRGTIAALQIDAAKLNEEAKLAIEKLPETRLGYVIELTHKIPVIADWKLAKNVNLSPAKVVEALFHPARFVVFTAMNLLVEGIDDIKAVQYLLQKALIKASGFPLKAISMLAPEMWGANEATKILLRKLRGKPTEDSDFLYQTLEDLVPQVDTNIVDKIKEAAISDLKSNNSELAAAAAKILSTLRPYFKEAFLIKLLKNSLREWEHKKTWCRRCQIYFDASSCSVCHVIPLNPRACLVKIFAELGGYDTNELLELCQDSRYDVSEIAYKILALRAKEDIGLLQSLITRIKDGLGPFDSATALNLLNQLLNLPADTLKLVQPALFELADSKIAAVRSCFVTSLTRGWVERNIANEIAQKALKDSVPAVRNSATKTLRLLENQK